MKIVVVSDLHADRDTLGVPRFDEVSRALNEARDYAIGNKVDAFLCLGDVADPDSGGASYRAAAMVIECALMLAEENIQNIWIAGNHDVFEDGSGATTLSALAAVERCNPHARDRIYVAEFPRVIALDPLDRIDDKENLDLLCLPYTPVSHTYDPRRSASGAFLVAEKKGRRVVIAAHLMIAGIVPGEETTEMPRGRDVAFPIEETSKAVLRLNGHYHHRQTTREGIVIPGSLARLTFSDEDHEPSFLVVDV